MSEGVSTYSPWKRWYLEEKDLNNIPDSTNNYCCPNCGTHTPEEDIYNVDGETYPQYYNEYLSSDMDGTIHDWDEVHCCPKCKTKYKFQNGCF